jgi:hypothetical protein
LLIWWVACPIVDETGRVSALVYGGRLLNHNHASVDRLRGMVLSDKDYHGKPLGTVTLFMGQVRAAIQKRDQELRTRNTASISASGWWNPPWTRRRSSSARGGSPWM